MKLKRPEKLKKRLRPKHQLNFKQTLLVFVLGFFVTFSISNMYIKASALDLPVHNIDTDSDYATIQEAIDAPETSDGHTIRVDAGIYYEHVIVNKAVKLIGAGQGVTRIDGNGTGYVISLNAHRVEISDFTIQNGERGINLDHIQNASVYNNIILNCSYRGIFVWGCSNCKVANNTVTYNKEANIELWKSRKTLITNNLVKTSSHGIYLLVNSTTNRIEGNVLTDNSQAIVLSYHCNNNTIAGNTVTGSSVGGIVMGGAHNNTIYHNNVLYNAKQAWSYGDSSNFWNDSTEGNFWKDYPGPDLDQDGIGDTPYTIDENNRDNHPLMGIFTDFNVAWEEETHHVCVISNSTISAFDFKVTYQPEVRKAIGFNVTGEDDAVGFCRVIIPTALINYPYTVLVNGEEVNTTILDISNSTNAYLYFTYNTSTKHVLIVPEFPSALTLPLLMILTVLAAALSKKKDNNGVVNIVETSLLSEVNSIATEQPIYAKVSFLILHILK